jgi:hypothetical protein
VLSLKLNFRKVSDISTAAWENSLVLQEPTFFLANW